MAWTPILSTKKEWQPTLSLNGVSSPTQPKPLLNPKIAQYQQEAQVAQQEAQKASSFGGLLKNTLLGIPKAGKEILFPTRGYTEPELKQARPTIKQGLLGVPKVAAEFSSGIGGLLGSSERSLATKIAQTKTGGQLADVGAKIQDFAVPKNVEEAKAMRIADVATLLPIGRLKNVGNLGEEAAKAFAKQEARKVATPVAEEFARQAQKAPITLPARIRGEAPKLKAPSGQPLLAKPEPVSLPKDTTLSSIQQAKASGQSFDEWVKVITEDKGGVGSGVEYAPWKRLVETSINNTPLTKFGFKPEQKITIYRGIDNATQKTIKEGDYIALSHDLAKSYTGGKVISQEVPASSIRLSSGDGLTAKDFKDINNLHIEAVYNPKPPITRSQLKAEWDSIAGKVDDITSSIKSAKQSGQSFDEWVKGQEEIGRSRYKTAATKMREASDIGDNAKFLEAQAEMTEANKLFRGNARSQLKAEWDGVNKETGLLQRAKDAFDNLPNKEGGFIRFNKKGVVEGDPAQTLKNVEKRVGVNRAEYDEGYFKRKPVELPEKLSMKELDLDLRKQAIESNPLNKLTRFESKTDKGRLPEVLGTGKGKFARKGDDIADELYGQRIDSEKVRADYEVFTENKEQLKTDEAIFREEVRRYKAEQKATKTPSSKVQPKSVPLLTGKSEGELRTLEESARQSLAKANQGGNLGDVSLPKMVEQSQTPVNKKVGALDYLRTPNRVLKKIGLEKNANEIRVQYDKYLDELPKNIDKITEWSNRVPKESNERIFKYLDGQAIDLRPDERKVAVEIKAWLEDWAERLKLPKDDRVTNYITHLFDDQLIKKEFDEDLAKIIADKVPGSVYDPFLQKRLGAKGYKQDVWKALDAYVKRGTRKVHMDVALENLEEVAGSLEQSQWEYVKKYADRINLRPTEWDTKFDNSLKQVVGYRFGQRPVANLSRSLRQMTFRGALGGNVSSALRNLSQGLNTYSKLGEKHTALGYMKLVTQGTKELVEQGILRDNFIQDRVLSATKKNLQRMDKALFAFFDMAEKINRGAAYYGAKSKALAQGMDEVKAIEFAKKIVRDTQFLYSNVDTPLLMQGDIAKVFMQFMSYPVKQTEFLAEMAKNKEFAGLLRYALGGLAFVYTAGKVMNMEPKELIPWSDYLSGDRKFGAPPSLKFPVELGKALLNTPDKYGQQRTLEDKARDVSKTLTGVIPAGTQIKKSFEGITSYNKGASVTPSGRVRYPIDQDLGTRIKTGLFGQYSLPQAKDYFNQNQIPLSEKQSERVLSAPNTTEAFNQVRQEQAQAKEKQATRDAFKSSTYNQVQELLKNGKMSEADSLVQALSPEDQELYKSIRTAERSKNTENLHDLLRQDPVKAVQFVRSQNEREKERLVERLNDKDSFTDEERDLYIKGKNGIINQ